MQTTRLFIGGLPADIDQQWIRTRFHASSVDIPASKNQTSPRKFAYAQVPTNQVPFLIKKFHNSKFRGNQVRVEIAKPSYLDRISDTNSKPVEIQQPEQTGPDLNSCENRVLKIRVGRKRAREHLVHKSTNPRHIKFSKESEQSDLNKNKKTCSKPITLNSKSEPQTQTAIQKPLSSLTKPSAGFCWSSVGGLANSHASSQSSDLAQTSFLLSRKELLDQVIPGVFQKKDPSPRQSSESEDSESDKDEELEDVEALVSSITQKQHSLGQSSESEDTSSENDEEPQDVYPVTSTADMNGKHDVSSKKEIEPESCNDDIKEDDNEGGLGSRRSDTVELEKNDDNAMVLEEIRESNQSMMSVYKSMFGITNDPKPNQNAMVWNHERRYDPNNQESIRNLSNELKEIDGDKANEIAIATDKVRLASEWTSLWAKQESNSNMFSQSMPFSLSQPEQEGESKPEQLPIPSAVIESVKREDIVVLERLRPSFLDRCSQQYLASGECCLFRRTATVGELIAACKEAKYKRVHAYKRQIKEHHQMEQSRRTRS